MNDECWSENTVCAQHNSIWWAGRFGIVFVAKRILIIKAIRCACLGFLCWRFAATDGGLLTKTVVHRQIESRHCYLRHALPCMLTHSCMICVPWQLLTIYALISIGFQNGLIAMAKARFGFENTPNPRTICGSTISTVQKRRLFGWHVSF